MIKKLFTLCIINQDSKILLGMKKAGFGEGQWNGFGGKVEEGEDIEAAALREVFEEAGITPVGIEKKGVLEFEFENDPKILEVHIFDAKDFEGEPSESNEMRPQWFDIKEIPYEKMWSDDIYWLPLLLEGKKFKGRFLFDKPSSLEYSAQIITQELKEVDEM